MPEVDIYLSHTVFQDLDLEIASKIKTHIAKLLSCTDRILKPEEITFRILRSEPIGMIAPVEISITAHHYHERVARQDEICKEVVAFFKKELEIDEDTKVKAWLRLCELGHSM